MWGGWRWCARAGARWWHCIAPVLLGACRACVYIRERVCEESAWWGRLHSVDAAWRLYLQQQSALPVLQPAGTSWRAPTKRGCLNSGQGPVGVIQRATRRHWQRGSKDVKAARESIMPRAPCTARGITDQMLRHTPPSRPWPCMQWRPWSKPHTGRHRAGGPAFNTQGAVAVGPACPPTHGTQAAACPGGHATGATPADNSRLRCWAPWHAW